MRKISFPVDNDVLNGTLFYPEETKKKNSSVLFLHGWQSNQSRYIQKAKALAELGYISLTFTRRDYQEKTGKYKLLTIEDHLQDVIAAYEYLASQEEVDRQYISVVGASYGGYLASLLSQERSIYGLALRVPALYPDEKYRDPKINVNVIHYSTNDYKPENNKALYAISKFHGRILIIESEHDEIIPHEIIEDYKHAVQNSRQLTYHCMSDATHSMKGEKEDVWQREFTQILIEWFNELQ